MSEMRPHLRRRSIHSHDQDRNSCETNCQRDSTRRSDEDYSSDPSRRERIVRPSFRRWSSFFCVKCKRSCQRTMRAEAKITLRLPSDKLLETLIRALEPEVRHSPYSRSRTTLSKCDSILILRVQAKDTAALRASLNSHLRWLNAALDVLETLDKYAE